MASRDFEGYVGRLTQDEAAELLPYVLQALTDDALLAVLKAELDVSLMEELGLEAEERLSGEGEGEEG